MQLPLTLILVASLSGAQTPDDLLNQAKQELATPAHGKQAAALLRQANQQWQSTNSTSSNYGESLDLLAILARLDSPAEAKAAAAAAVPIREAHPEEVEPLALAYEVQADAIGRPDPAAEAVWGKAFVLRQRLVLAMPSDPAAQSLDLFKVGGQVSAPALVSKEQPRYTNYAMYKKCQGSVLLSIVVSSDGVPGQFQLLRGLGYGLDEAAAQAVRHWRFRPASRNGTPVAVRANIQISFRLLDNAPLP